VFTTTSSSPSHPVITAERGVAIQSGFMVMERTHHNVSNYFMNSTVIGDDRVEHHRRHVHPGSPPPPTHSEHLLPRRQVRGSRTAD